jgi:two-component system, NtrC family, response regulator GlrR
VPIDVRVIAATNRDLRAEVNATRFRADLYYRLAVVRIPLPPLRARPDDLPLLVDEILARLKAPPEAIAAFTQADFLASLRHAPWPGNVRELRNYLERCLVFHEPLPIGDAGYAEGATQGAPDIIDPTLSYDEVRRRALADFERRYVEALVAHHQGKVPAAARAAGVDKAYIYRLMRKYGIRA